MDKLISIIVPVYNVEEYVSRCIDSLINQTYENIEVILVNDGSTDTSLTICEKYKDQRIKIYTKENGGLSSARNHGMKFYHGDFVLFVDSDDYIKLSTVEVMLNKAVETNSDLVICDMEYLYDDKHTEFTSGGNFKEGNYQEDHNLLFINNSACNKLIHKSLLENFKFPEGLWYEDLGSIPLLITKAKKIVKVDEPLYVYYQREDSIAHSANLKIFDVYKAIRIIEEQVDINVKTLYIIHGLDLTTLRIKDFKEKDLREQFLKDNLEHLNKYYPDWAKDPYIKNYGLKKRIIFKLLENRKYSIILKIYDRGNK